MQDLSAEGHNVKALDNRPDLFVGLDFYFTAYRQLRYDRPIGMAVGPIPWSSISKWGEMHGLDADDINVLEHHIRAMERAIADFDQKRDSKGKGGLNDR